jgi:hypothetical protein
MIELFLLISSNHKQNDENKMLKLELGLDLADLNAMEVVGCETQNLIMLHRVQF